MKNIIRKLPIWALMVWPYLIFIGMLLPDSSFFGIYCILTLVLCIVNLVNVWKYKAENAAKELSLWGMVTKLVHTPFYVAVMLFSAMLIMSIASGAGASQVPPIVLFLIIFAFLFMITSSLYCAKAAMAGHEKEVIKKEHAMMYAICSFMFVGDIICSVLIFYKIKQNKKVKKSLNAGK